MIPSFCFLKLTRFRYFGTIIVEKKIFYVFVREKVLKKLAWRTSRMRATTRMWVVDRGRGLFCLVSFDHNTLASDPRRVLTQWYFSSPRPPGNTWSRVSSINSRISSPSRLWPTTRALCRWTRAQISHKISEDPVRAGR